MNKQINITAIPKDLKFEGYIWMSDSDEPTLFKKEELNTKKLLISDENTEQYFDSISDSSNPFVIEGHLYAEQEQKSYSIRYADGMHIVVEYDLIKVPEDWVLDDKPKKFIPNRLQASKIVFWQYWKPERDEFCENMGVLQPAAFVFAGFEYESKIKEEK